MWQGMGVPIWKNKPGGPVSLEGAGAAIYHSKAPQGERHGPKRRAKGKCARTLILTENGDYVQSEEEWRANHEDEQRARPKLETCGARTDKGNRCRPLYWVGAPKSPIARKEQRCNEKGDTHSEKINS